MHSWHADPRDRCARPPRQRPDCRAGAGRITGSRTRGHSGLSTVCKPAAESSSGGRVILWIDAQLSPALARWMSETFGITLHAVRDVGLRDAKDLPIFHAARAAGAVLMSNDSDVVLLLE